MSSELAALTSPSPSEISGDVKARNSIPVCCCLATCALPVSPESFGSGFASCWFVMWPCSPPPPPAPVL
jgi:hypothetical protein